MTSNPHVVLYGHDDTLHLTRRWLLERMGFEVSTAGTFFALDRIYKRRATQLLVVCYTVEIAECDQIVALSRSACPYLKVVMLSSLVHRNPSHSHAQSEIFLESPAAFSLAIQRLINNAELSPRPTLLN